MEPFDVVVGFVCRDGPDQSSPQIGQFSGNTALESVYSTSNIILIKFHSDFSGAGFFVLSYHGEIFTHLHQDVSWFVLDSKTEDTGQI